MEYVILYNPRSCAGKGFETAKKIEALMPQDTFTYHDFTKISSLSDFLATLPSDSSLVLAGGDGSLNSFVNMLGDCTLENDLYFFPSGNGNDFARDIGIKKGAKPVLINQYIESLPTAHIKGKTHRFLNCVGSGMDGYCCGEVEAARNANKKGSYMLAAIKALLYGYKSCTAHVVADGKEYTFENTWLVPAMNGKFFGGGFMAAPDQERLNPNGTISLVAMHSRNFFKIVVAFLLIMKGKHTKMKSMIHVIEGHEFSVKLDRSATLQIDGETIYDVSEYTISSAKKKATA